MDAIRHEVHAFVRLTERLERLHAEKHAILHQSHRVAIETLTVIDRSRIEMEASAVAVAQMRQEIKREH
jgi:hypothetical protein